MRKMCRKLLFSREVDVKDALPQLASAAEALLMREGQVETGSATARQACLRLLSSIEWTARALRVPITSRKYREQFTINYRALFPDIAARHYRVDIFEAAMQWSGTRWVNGERFDLTVEALECAQGLQGAWTTLGTTVKRWSAEGSGQVTKDVREEVKHALVEFDHVWTLFEQRYIVELIEIEAAARGLVLRAVEEERKLRRMEAKKGGNMTSVSSIGSRDSSNEQDLSLQRKALIDTISRLNSAANLRWKGREDNGAQALEEALATKRRLLASAEADAAVAHSEASVNELLTSPGERAVASVLSDGCIQAFGRVREYLREVPNWIDAVHPHLCNNNGLVTIMCAWTDAWELAHRYMQPPPLLRSTGDLLENIRTARSLAPELASMCDECDAELFLALPRLVLLWFLEDTANRGDLIRRLVPHHFLDEDGKEIYSEDLAIFVKAFRHVRAMLAKSPEALEYALPEGHDGIGSRDPQRVAVEVLIVRAIDGPGGSTGSSPVSSGIRRAVSEANVIRARSVPPIGVARGAAIVRTDSTPKHATTSKSGLMDWTSGCTGGHEGETELEAEFFEEEEQEATIIEVDATVEAFIRSLERWSMEVQRNRPEDWCQCSSVLVRCLSPEHSPASAVNSKYGDQAPFCV